MMDAAQTQPSMSQEAMLTPSNSIPKILVGRSANFERIINSNDIYHHSDRPMMLNAWSQTTNDDFHFLYQNNRNDQDQYVRSLIEKIQVLEDNLQTQSDLLSQIHETAGRKRQLQHLTPESTITTTHISPPQPPLMQPIQHQRQTLQNTPQQSYQETNPYQQMIPASHKRFQAIVEAAAAAAAGVTTTTHSPTVINPTQHAPTTNSHTESFKYTIVADGRGDTNTPIQIQLAEEDGAHNLNSSAESGRLEICLGDEPNETTIKSEICEKNHELNEDPAFIKRRKMINANNDIHANSTINYSFDQFGTPLQAGRIADHLQSINHNNCEMKKKAATVPYRKNTNSSRKGRDNLQATSTSDSHILSDKMDLQNVKVCLGPNNTYVDAKVYDSMNWSTASIATRKLLVTLFNRQTLATHSMTGKPSPAFKDQDKPLKQMLDPKIIQDIIYTVTRKCNVSDKEVRSAITTKCADENKMLKLQMSKAQGSNKEN